MVCGGTVEFLSKELDIKSSTGKQAAVITAACSFFPIRGTLLVDLSAVRGDDLLFS